MDATSVYFQPTIRRYKPRRQNSSYYFNIIKNISFKHFLNTVWRSAKKDLHDLNPSLISKLFAPPPLKEIMAARICSTILCLYTKKQWLWRIRSPSQMPELFKSKWNYRNIKTFLEKFNFHLRTAEHHHNQIRYFYTGENDSFKQETTSSLLLIKFQRRYPNFISFISPVVSNEMIRQLK
jgi:hypothetical protein